MALYECTLFSIHSSAELFVLDVFSLLVYVSRFNIKNQMAIGVEFMSGSLIPLIYLSLFMPI